MSSGRALQPAREPVSRVERDRVEDAERAVDGDPPQRNVPQRCADQGERDESDAGDEQETYSAEGRDFIHGLM
jgi:hypothetical protein